MPFRSISHEQKIQSAANGPNRTLVAFAANGGFEPIVTDAAERSGGNKGRWPQPVDATL
jgi:hypothetical protein